MKKAFVTGGAGHVGGNLVRQLLSDGWDVRCLIHKDARSLDGLDVVRAEGSITNTDILSDQTCSADAMVTSGNLGLEDCHESDKF